jgi:Domain of unknown function (DUF4388)
LALQGTLDTFALPDVLHLLAATSKTGRLHIEGDRGTGGVWVANGAVVGADADCSRDRTPVAEVVFELLRFTSGSFVFDGTAAPPSTDRPEDVGTLLRRAHALLSEWSELESVVPSLDHRVALAGDLSADEVTIDADRWRLVVAVAAGCTVGELASTLGLTELGVSRAVRDIVDLGVAEVAPPGTARSATAPPPAPAVQSAAPAHAVVDGDRGRPEPAPLPDGVAPIGRTSPVSGKPQRAGWLTGDRTGEVPAVDPGRRGAPATNGNARGSRDVGVPTDPPVLSPPDPPAPESPPRGGLTSRRGRNRNANALPPADPSSGGSARRTTGSTPVVGPVVGNGAGPSAPASRSALPSRTNDAGRGRNGTAGPGHDSSGRGTSSRSGAGAPSPRQTPSGPSRGPEPPRSSSPSRSSTSNGLPRRSGPSRGDTSRGRGPGSGPGRGTGAPNGRGAGAGGPSFDGGTFGPQSLGPDTGKIPPVSPSSLPPDLHWAADDTLAGPLNGSSGNGPITGPIAGPVTGPVASPFSGLTSLGPGPAPVPPPNRALPPVNEHEMAPHVAAMSPQARAAVQATVGNAGGSTGGRGSQGEDIAQRGRLISFLSTVR